MNEIKRIEIKLRLKGWVQKIFWTWPSSLIKGFNKIWSFFMDESKHDETKYQFMLKKPFFLPTIQIEEIFS